MNEPWRIQNKAVWLSVELHQLLTDCQNWHGEDIIYLDVNEGVAQAGQRLLLLRSLVLGTAFIT